MSDKNKIWICSVDIGKKNFCFYIEETNFNSLKRLKNIEYSVRYNENGTPTTDMKKLLQKVGKNGKTILHINKDLTYDTDKEKYFDKKIYYNMIEHLDSHKEYLSKCSIFVVEQQMIKNSMATRLGQHCLTYFMCRYPETTVVEFPSYNKTCVLGAEKIKGKMNKNGKYKWKTMDQRTRKKWAVTKAYEILTERGESETMDNIKTKSKKDDLSDTVIQLWAFKYLYFVNKTEF